MTSAGDIAKQLIDADGASPNRDSGHAARTAPVSSRLQPFRAFPVDSLPDPLRSLVQAVSAATGTDPSWSALAALVVAAGCIGNRAAASPKRGWIEPAILWAALVGKSGSTKSVVLRLVTRPLVELFKIERESFREKLRAYAADMERHQVEKSKWKAEQRAEQKTGPPTDPPVEPEEPREKRVLVADVTVEKLAALLGENPLGLLVVRDELAGLINSFNRYAGGKGSDLQAWLSMNDGGALLVDRKCDGSTFVERASVSLLGSIQPFTLEHVFGTTEREAGLLARVLLGYPPDQPALWTEAELSDEVAIEWRDLLAAFMSLQPGRDDHGRPRPRLISLAEDTKKVFVEWHDRHAREVADLTNDHLRAHWSKLKGTCVRIALIFACTEATAGEHVSAVSLDSIQRAIEVTEWFKAESARIYAGFGETEADRLRRAVVRWIEQRGGSTTVRELTHGNWAFRNDNSGARSMLESLVASGCGRWVVQPSGAGGGRPTERFELVPISASPSPKPPQTSS
jgi:hypothetical protein